MNDEGNFCEGIEGGVFWSSGLSFEDINYFGLEFDVGDVK